MHLKQIIRLLPSYRLYRNGIGVFNEEFLTSFIDKAIKDVPYYNINPEYIKPYEDFPILRKNDVCANEDDFLSKKYVKFFLKRSATGGTSGVSLNLYRSFKDIIKEVAYVDYAFSLIGGNLSIAVLRGNKISSRIGEKIGGTLFLSSYNLSENTISEYLDMLKRNSIDCLHAYPTSIMIFLKLVDYSNRISELNSIKGILTSSEVLTIEDKKYIKKKLPHIKLIDLYGQNEHVAFAIAVDLCPYRFFNCYGYTEFIRLKENNDGNDIAEIVSTGFANSAMPLIRYGTEDFVKIDKYGQIISIIGRGQDYLYDVNGERIPCTIVTRPDTLRNVLYFQFFQEEFGNVEFRIVVNNNFGERDKNEILFDFFTTFNNRIKAKVRILNSLEKTNAGKIRRLIQLVKL